MVRWPRVRLADGNPNANDFLSSFPLFVLVFLVVLVPARIHLVSRVLLLLFLRLILVRQPQAAKTPSACAVVGELLKAWLYYRSSIFHRPVRGAYSGRSKYEFVFLFNFRFRSISFFFFLYRYATPVLICLGRHLPSRRDHHRGGDLSWYSFSPSSSRFSSDHCLPGQNRSRKKKTQERSSTQEKTQADRSRKHRRQGLA